MFVGKISSKGWFYFEIVESYFIWGVKGKERVLVGSRKGILLI